MIETVATHEAGHAVLRLVLGLHAHRVWISEYTGRCEHDGIIDQPFGHAIACLAGPQSVHYCLPGVDPKYGADRDFQEARATLQRLDESADVLWKRAWERVIELVAQRENEIRLIAAALMTFRELSAYSIRNLLQRPVSDTIWFCGGMECLH